MTWWKLNRFSSQKVSQLTYNYELWLWETRSSPVQSLFTLLRFHQADYSCHVMTSPGSQLGLTSLTWPPRHDKPVSRVRESFSQVRLSVWLSGSEQQDVRSVVWCQVPGLLLPHQHLQSPGRTTWWQQQHHHCESLSTSHLSPLKRSSKIQTAMTT